MVTNESFEQAINIYFLKLYPIKHTLSDNEGFSQVTQVITNYNQHMRDTDELRFLN